MKTKLLQTNAILPLEKPVDCIDCYRAYELSWLNEKGKPQIEVLQIKLINSYRLVLDNRSLKEYLNSYAMQYFAQDKLLNLIKKHLTAVLNCRVEVAILDKLSIDNVLPVSQSFRFICANTKQPVVGKVYTDSNSDKLIDYLLEIRTQQHTAWQLANSLYEHISANVLSIVAYRKGGIAYQGIRAATNADSYVARELCE